MEASEARGRSRAGRVTALSGVVQNSHRVMRLAAGGIKFWTTSWTRPGLGAAELPLY
jgi:hypothetical protein